MAKVQIAVKSSEKERVLTWLQDEEVLHLDALPDDEYLTPGPSPKLGEGSATAYKLAQVQFGLEFFTRIREELGIKVKQSLKDMFYGKPLASLPELTQSLGEFEQNHQELFELQEFSEKLAESKARQNEIEARIKALEPWKNLNLSGGRDDAVAHRLVEVKLSQLEAVIAALSDVRTAAWQEVSKTVLKKGQGQAYLEVIAHTDDTSALDEALKGKGANVVELGLEERETAASTVQSLKASLSEEKAVYTSEMAKAKGLLEHEDHLKKVYDALLHKQERENLEAATRSFASAFVIGGWIPKKILPAVETKLERDFTEVALEEVGLAKDEVPPVALQNSKAMQPFEAVTNIYGKPKYSELDPSVLLSLFFLVSFGLALTDAGYGIVLMVGTAAALKIFRIKKETKKLIKLLFYAGLFTTIIGSLTGGWFGITLEELNPSPVRDALLSIKLIDPIKSPMALLGAAFIIGIVQLLFAWGVKGYDAWRNGDKVSAVFDGLAWITLVSLILAWAWFRTDELKNLALLNAGVLVLTQGRAHKNPLLKIGAGTLSLYGLVSFMSDVLSYSRLLALGLATGIIGLVVNLIGAMVVDMIPVIGIAIAVVVLLVGHVFNLGINALGAFIHAGRLQFVEFFPKFIEGGGVPYKPLGRIGKYVDNPREFNN